jgi:hypothetical protein
MQDTVAWYLLQGLMSERTYKVGVFVRKVFVEWKALGKGSVAYLMCYLRVLGCSTHLMATADRILSTLRYQP